MILPNLQRACVIGAGGWGTALAQLLCRRELSVTLWARRAELAQEISRSSINEAYLPGVILPDELRVTSDLDNAVAGADLILLAVPSQGMRAVCESLARAGVRENAILLSCTKGIEEGGKRMTEVIADELPGRPVAVLSGPNHAEEVSKKLPSASVIGAHDEHVALVLQRVFTLPWLRSYTSDDVTGIEVGGAVKNVFAIGAGIAAGLGLGDNARAALVTRGLAEMARLGQAMGGRRETFQGLSGMGDLVVTCYSDHSRNQRLGRRLGQGEKLSEILATSNTVAEGVPNTLSIYHLAAAVGIEAPLTEQAYEVLYREKDPKTSLIELLSREPKAESVTAY